MFFQVSGFNQELVLTCFFSIFMRF